MNEHTTRGSSGGTDTVRTNPHQAINPVGETRIEKRLRRQHEEQARRDLAAASRARRAAALAAMEEEL